MTETVRYEQQDAVAIISLDRPDALNGFTDALRADLHNALQRAANDTAVRAVVLTGEGRCFSAGADLKAGFDSASDRGVEGQLQDEYRPTLEAIADMPKPVIAAVNGFAAGIGLSYALQCDLVMMSEDAFMLSPFTTISLVPDGGANWSLVRHLGYHRAYELSIEGTRIPAARCVELGLANRTSPADSLLDDAIAWQRACQTRAPVAGGDQEGHALRDGPGLGIGLRPRGPAAGRAAGVGRCQGRGRRVLREAQPGIQGKIGRFTARRARWPAGASVSFAGLSVAALAAPPDHTNCERQDHATTTIRRRT